MTKPISNVTLPFRINCVEIELEDGTRAYQNVNGKIIMPNEPLQPFELRECAYEKNEIIPYEDNLITVDKANQLYLQYLAEGDNIRVSELSSLIATAKASIREQYPDIE